jgi:hypothetical protein
MPTYVKWCYVLIIDLTELFSDVLDEQPEFQFIIKEESYDLTELPEFQFIKRIDMFISWLNWT